ncbi:MAG: HigA family addiction module antitoxin, partial [Acidimicrobiia bacterium]
MTSMVRAAEVFPPSEYLREELEARGWTEVEFAHILDRPIQMVSEILNDRKEITPETALEIGHALGTSPELWLNLQATYRLEVARKDADLTRVERRARLRGFVPIREVRNRGWIPDTDDLDVMEEAVCNFLGMASLDDEPRFSVAARRTNADTRLTPEQTAWIARVRQLAAQSDSPQYERSKLTDLAP